MKPHVAWILVALLTVSSVLAIGASPPRIILEDIPKATPVTKSIILSGIEPGSEVSFRYKGTGKEWVRSSLGDQFIFPDSSRIDLPFTIDVPQKTPNGAYHVQAEVIVTAKGSTDGATGAVVSEGVLIDIRFTVSGEEVKKYDLKHITVPPTEQGAALLVVTTLDNQGNILAQPDAVSIIVKDKTQKKTLFNRETTQITPVEPFTVGDSIASFQPRLDPGQYFADVTVTLDGTAHERHNIPFDVYEAGGIDAQGVFTSFAVEGEVEDIAKLKAAFQNTGDQDIYASLKGDVFVRGKLVETFTSDPIFVRRNAEESFVYYYSTKKSGAHVIKAHILYYGKRTSEREVSFTVAGLPWLSIGGGAGALVVLILFILLLKKLFGRKKRKRKKKSKKKKKRKKRKSKKKAKRTAKKSKRKTKKAKSRKTAKKTKKKTKKKAKKSKKRRKKK